MDQLSMLNGKIEMIKGEPVRILPRTIWSSYMIDPDAIIWGDGRKRFLIALDNLWANDKGSVAAWKFLDLHIVDAETRARAATASTKDGSRTMRVPPDKKPSSLGQFNSTLLTIMTKGYVAGSRGGKGSDIWKSYRRQSIESKKEKPFKMHHSTSEITVPSNFEIGNQEFLIDKGLFIGQNRLSFTLVETYETISNLLKTIKEYRDYTQPGSATWEEYVHEFFHILGFDTQKQEPRLLALRDIGANGKPRALVVFIQPGENFDEIVPGLDWLSYLFYAASYHSVEWGLLTNGLHLKVVNFNSDYQQIYFWSNIDGIVENERIDSFFTIYKVFSYIKRVTDFPPNTRRKDLIENLKGVSKEEIHPKQKIHNQIAKTKSPNKILKVTLRDGHVIQENSCSDTLVSVIRYLGIDRVKELNLKSRQSPLCKYELITEYPIEDQCSKQLGKYFIQTHGSTPEKHYVLEKIKAGFPEEIIKIEMS